MVGGAFVLVSWVRVGWVTASGATAVQIVRRENGRDVVIEHLGSAHTDADLALFMDAGRREVEEGQGVLDLGRDAKQDPMQALVQSASSRLLIEVIDAAWPPSGSTPSSMGGFQLVLVRLVEPTSMSDAARILDDIGIAAVHRNTFTATLRRCGQRDYRDTIATACFNHAATLGDVSLVLYDATILYFGAYKSAACRSGSWVLCRARRRHLKVL